MGSGPGHDGEVRVAAMGSGGGDWWRQQVVAVIGGDGDGVVRTRREKEGEEKNKLCDFFDEHKTLGFFKIDLV